MDIVVLPGPDELATAVADRIESGVRAALEQRGRATLAVSGGRTPEPMLADLARRDLDWSAVTIVQVDERVAPDGHDDRNATMLDRALLRHVTATVHLMPVTDPDLDAAAEDYGRLIREVCDGIVDVVHLGLGPDGHTASLVPGDPVLDVADRDVAVTGEYQGRRRMTMTFPLLNRARAIVWEVAGEEAAQAVRRLVGGGDIPGAAVARDWAVLVVDAEAARLL